jgi:hypothetical protein
VVDVADDPLPPSPVEVGIVVFGVGLAALSYALAIAVRKQEWMFWAARVSLVVVVGGLALGTRDAPLHDLTRAVRPGRPTYDRNGNQLSVAHCTCVVMVCRHRTDAELDLMQKFPGIREDDGQAVDVISRRSPP